MTDPQPAFSLVSRPDADRFVLELSGELDAGTVPVFQEGFGAALAAGHADIVIDLAALDFIDSIGLQAFLAARNATNSRGSTLTFTQGGPEVQRLMSLTGFDTVFHFARRHLL